MVVDVVEGGGNELVVICSQHLKALETLKVERRKVSNLVDER